MTSMVGVVDDTVIGVTGRYWFLLHDVVAIVIVPDVKTKCSRIDVAVAPDEHGTEDWLRKDIENTVEYSF